MKKLLGAAFAAIFASGLAALAANLPSLTGPQDPSQLNATVNALINQLGGGPGYSGTAQVVSLGTYGTISGGTPQILNTQRGIVSFTGVATLVTGAVTTLTITNSLVTAASACEAHVQSGGAAGSGPYVSTVTPTTGSLAVILANGGTTATGATQTFAIAFNCYQ